MLAAIALLAAVQSAPIDSEVVLHEYAQKLLTIESPKVLVFSYTLSQAGPQDIEQTHHVYRSGDLVRDEIVIDQGVKARAIRISRYRNRYSLENLAPRLTQYTFMFDGLRKAGNVLQYEYHAIPNSPGGSFVVDSLVLDGASFLPVTIRFHSASGAASGKGSITFARSGKYWVPVVANVEGRAHGKAARERIVFSAYRFPLSLPRSTFQVPRPLPSATPPPAF